jgi:hypothetical protein
MMKRRQFIQKTTLTVGGLMSPAIFTSKHSLFAQSGVTKADHVVLVMFAGGVRQQESVLGRYLDDSQGVSGAIGNIMPNLFNGMAPTKKIVYGQSINGMPAGSEPIPRLVSETLSKQGTLFPEVTAQSAGHYVGLNTLLTGSLSLAQGLKNRPVAPTIFEYLRKHRGFKATDCWFVGNSLGNSTPLLNCSSHPDYGLDYGGNMFIPPITFGTYGRNILANAKSYNQSDYAPAYEMKEFLDRSFSLEQSLVSTIKNTDDERTQIKEFIRNTFLKQNLGQIEMPPVSLNGDAFNIAYAAAILKEFKPKMLAVNLSAVDGCHSNFTNYLRSLHHADHITAWLYQYIQNNIPELSGNTIFIVAPECGRNLKPNPILDENNWYAYDHSDANSLRVWSLMVGKNVPKNNTIGNELNPIGRITDIVPTIADIFGIYNEVKNSGTIDPNAISLFDRI